MSPKPGIGFDLFNTLVWIPGKHRAYRDLIAHFESRGIGREAVVHALLTQEEQSVAFLFGQFSLSPDHHLIQQTDAAVQAEVESTELYPETLSALTQLSKSYSLCLISNLSCPYIAVAHRLGLDAHFDFLLFSCEAGCIKPKKRIFRKAIDRMKQSGAQLNFMVGDSFRDDINGAEAAGIRGILMDRNQISNKVDGVRDLNEIEALIKD